MLSDSAKPAQSLFSFGIPFLVGQFQDIKKNDQTACGINQTS